MIKTESHLDINFDEGERKLMMNIVEEMTAKLLVDAGIKKGIHVLEVAIVVTSYL